MIYVCFLGGDWEKVDRKIGRKMTNNKRKLPKNGRTFFQNATGNLIARLPDFVHV